MVPPSVCLDAVTIYREHSEGKTSTRLIAVVTCAWCGSVADGDEPPLTWVSSVEASGTRYYCERCSRENLRSIEGKLDSTWW